MFRLIPVAAALTLSLASFAANPGNNSTTTQGSGTTANAPTTHIDGTKHRSDKKTLKANCEAQVRRQNLTPQKAKAAIAACEKS
jgi:hypothetical protein